MEQIACVPAHVSYFLCCTRKSNAVLTQYGTRWALMWTHPFFKHTHARIRVRCRCPSTRSRLGAQKWAPGPSMHTVFVSSVAVRPRLRNHCKAHVFFKKKHLTGVICTQLHIGYSRFKRDTFLGRYRGTNSRRAVWTVPEKWNRTFAYHV